MRLIGDFKEMGTASDHHLAIDIGNSGAKAAVFRNGVMTGPVVRFTDQEWEVADQLVTNHGVKNIIYSTVANVPPKRWVDKWESEECLVLELSAQLPLPFQSLYKTMDTLGHDRIAVVAGSFALPAFTAPAAAPENGKQNVRNDLGRVEHTTPARLIVDAGTCATMDLVDATGVYLGGNISPGLRMRLRAMHAFTARLPLPNPAEPEGLVGLSTVDALRHGGQLGLVYEIEGFFRRLQVHYPDLELLLTGGDGNWIAQHLSIPCRFNPYLVLLGLNQILSNYVQNES